jgi:hypothetical protein
MLDLLRGFGQGNALAEVRGLITGLPPA